MNKRNSAINILFIIICLTSFCIFSINFSRENEAKNQPKCYNSSITKSDTDPFEGILFEGKPNEIAMIFLNLEYLILIINDDHDGEMFSS